MLAAGVRDTFFLKQDCHKELTIANFNLIGGKKLSLQIYRQHSHV